MAPSIRARWVTVRARWTTVQAKWRTARAPGPTLQIARILAQMGAALAPEADRSVSEASRDLRDLQVARTGLVTERTRSRNRSKTQGNRVLTLQTRTRLALALAADHGAGRYRSRNASPRTHRRKREMLRRVPGPWPRRRCRDPDLARRGCSGRSDLTACPRPPPPSGRPSSELGTMGRKQVGSLAGLAPHPRQSGQWKGKSFISGGRKPLRDALYMPALVAMRHNPDLKAKYTALRAAGEPAKVAIVVFVGKTAPHAVFWLASLRAPGDRQRARQGAPNVGRKGPLAKTDTHPRALPPSSMAGRRRGPLRSS